MQVAGFLRRSGACGIARVMAPAVAFALTIMVGLTPDRSYAAQAATVQVEAASTDEVVISDPEVPSQPFGVPASVVDDGSLFDKWQDVKRAITVEMAMLQQCRVSVAPCTSPAASQFLAIVDHARTQDGLARAGDINRAVNLMVRPVEDTVQYHAEDVWSSPLQTLTNGAGDCEDYAIAKFVALGEAGVAPEDRRLVILRHRLSQEDHAVVAVRIASGWRLLDNRGFVMRDEAQYVAFRPLFVIDDRSIRRYDEPAMVSAIELPARTLF
jgi:predicted transglutaminase-like cysteine proteinase